MKPEIRFDQAALPPVLLAIILIALAILIIRSYRKEGVGRYSPRVLWSLCGLRILAVAAIVFILLKPALFRLEETAEAGRVLLLVDVSESMDISDAPGKRYVAARSIASRFVEKAGDGIRVEAYRFSAFPSPVEPGGLDSLEIERSGATSIGGSLEEAVQAQSGAPVAAAVALSDGQQNTGTDPEKVAGFLRQRNIPVFTVGVGSESPFQDLELREFSGPRLVFRGEEARLTLRVVNFGFDTQSVPLRIRVAGYRPPPGGGPVNPPEGAVLVDEPLSLPPPGTEDRHTFPFVPEYEGVYRLVAEIPSIPGEEITNNNTRQLDLEVTRKRLRVLLIESSPRWEYTFILRALRMDRRFAAAGLVELQNGNFHYQGAELFPESPMAGTIHHPPLDPDWNRLDAVILGDVPVDRFLPESLEHLRRQVEGKGLALFVIPGETTAPVRGFESTPIGPLLPFRGLGAPIGGPVTVLPAAAGLDHPIMQVGPAGTATDEVWPNLEPLWAVYRVEDVVPGSVVLAETSVAGEVRPVIAFRRAGEGKVLEMAVDDTWRWRVGSPTGDVVGPTAAAFWRQAVRWLVTGRIDDPGGGLRLLVEASTFSRGERVEIEAMVSAPPQLADTSIRVTAEIVGPDGVSEPVQFSPAGSSGDEPPGLAGSLRYTFVPLVFGSYLIRATALADDKEIGRDEKAFLVSESGLERMRTSLNRSLLRELSESTGGRYLDARDADRLPALIPRRETVRVEPVTTDLWDSPLIFLIFVAAVAVEWLIRKRKDLA